ncbi:hypothetical protein ACM44_01945 [Chryseobacterium koreense CCUG 49689]|uniref:Uncharacterized protein n=1 Tax=Chryseobacterium koreense CCUG 49689 TaxID=1304281 RepID=A0A0J7J3H3_9FLAO|nr:hypothetical protein ACM44_01945 [Chryseobacterium koreense CCUG 49689]
MEKAKIAKKFADEACCKTLFFVRNISLCETLEKEILANGQTKIYKYFKQRRYRLLTIDKDFFTAFEIKFDFRFFLSTERESI